MKKIIEMLKRAHRAILDVWEVSAALIVILIAFLLNNLMWIWYLMNIGG